MFMIELLPPPKEKLTIAIVFDGKDYQVFVTTLSYVLKIVTLTPSEGEAGIIDMVMTEKVSFREAVMNQKFDFELLLKMPGDEKAKPIKEADLFNLAHPNA